MPPRSNVNGTLLQTLNLPKLQFLSAKEDLYFTTTKQVSKDNWLLSEFPSPNLGIQHTKEQWNGTHVKVLWSNLSVSPVQNTLESLGRCEQLWIRIVQYLIQIFPDFNKHAKLLKYIFYKYNNGF